ncbi:MAG: hypothetical protein QM778_33910 [Myxococcales bacterium]
MKPTSLFKRVFDFARAELERRAKPNQDDEREPAEAYAIGAAGAAFDPPRGEVRGGGAPELRGLEVVRTERAGVRLSWSISDAEIQRARALIDPEAVLCVRVVAFSPLRDDVLRQVQDRPGVEPRGECDAGMVDGRAIVSIGLRSGERFVSITHHTL